MAAGAVLEAAAQRQLDGPAVRQRRHQCLRHRQGLAHSRGGGPLEPLRRQRLSSDAHTGTGIVNTTTSVTVNGTIQLGINNQQSLTIQKDILQNRTTSHRPAGSRSPRPPNSSPPTWPAAPAAAGPARAYVGDTNAETAYKADIQQIQCQMQQLGPGGNADQRDGAAGLRPDHVRRVPFITVSPILAEAGTIYVDRRRPARQRSTARAGRRKHHYHQQQPGLPPDRPDLHPAELRGHGLLRRHLRHAMPRPSGINKNRTVPAFTSPGRQHLEPPCGHDHQHLQRVDPANAGFEGRHFVTPDIDLDGNISAPPTVLTVYSQGSVITNANIDVGKVKITAGENFIQSYIPGIDSIGGDPSTLYEGVTNLTEATTATGLTPPLGTNLSVAADSGGTAVQQAVYNAINSTGEGNILAANDVFISAQYLNIDGTIQSGAARSSGDDRQRQRSALQPEHSGVDGDGEHHRRHQCRGGRVSSKPERDAVGRAHRRRRQVRAIERGPGQCLRVVRIRPDRLGLDLRGQRRDLRQRLRVHHRQRHAGGWPGRLLAAAGLVQPDRGRLGRRLLPDQLPGGTAGRRHTRTSRC